MAACDHAYTLDSIKAGPTPTAPRLATLVCTRCEHRQPVYTSRTDAEIQAELEAQKS